MRACFEKSDKVWVGCIDGLTDLRNTFAFRLLRSVSFAPLLSLLLYTYVGGVGDGGVGSVDDGPSSLVGLLWSQ